MEYLWTTGRFANEWGLRPIYSMIQKLCKSSFRPTYVGSTYTGSVALNAKLWQRFDINRWPSQWSSDHVQHLRNLLVPQKCCQLWHVAYLQGGKLYNFCSIKSFLFKTGGFQLGLQENQLMTVIIMTVSVITEQGTHHKRRRGWARGYFVSPFVWRASVWLQ